MRVALSVVWSLGAFVSASVIVALAAAQPVYVRLNQVGYLPAEKKMALALTNADMSGRTFTIVTTDGEIPSFTGAVGKDRGAYGNFAHLYELDFSGLTTSSKYLIRLEGESSVPFTIGDNVYASVISPTLTFFREQRCGVTGPLLHGTCHLEDGRIAQLEAAGGWHDAGDYLKFVTTVSFATVLMLHSYERHPEVFADANGNQVPKVLDEARVGLDWLLKMWDPENQVLYYQVGDYRDHNVGWRRPEGDDENYPMIRTVWACEDGKGANIAGKTAAALALAAKLWNDPARPFYDASRAGRYLAAARKIYEFGKTRPAGQSSTNNAGGSPFYKEDNWRDKMALAAAELYRATGEAAYSSEAKEYAVEAGSEGSLYWGEVGALAQYEIARLDPTYVDTATDFLLRDLSLYQIRYTANAFRASVNSFDWGSAETMVGAALTALWYEDLTGKRTYRSLAQAQRDYLLGNNAWGVCFVNGVGTTWPHHPHHQVADLTGSELTGFWDEGPVSLATFPDITLRMPDCFAEFQSEEAIYHDDVEDSVTNEPTIAMNALGLALTAWYAQTGGNFARRVGSNRCFSPVAHAKHPQGSRGPLWLAVVGAGSYVGESQFAGNSTVVQGRAGRGRVPRVTPVSLSRTPRDGAVQWAPANRRR